MSDVRSCLTLSYWILIIFHLNSNASLIKIHDFFHDHEKMTFSSFWHGFLNCSENEEMKKSSLFTSTGWWRQFNGFYFSLGAISSHSWPSVTRGWKWHLVRDKNHFIFSTPVTVNKYSFTFLTRRKLFFFAGTTLTRASRGCCSAASRPSRPRCRASTSDPSSSNPSRGYSSTHSYSTSLSRWVYHEDQKFLTLPAKF